MKKFFWFVLIIALSTLPRSVKAQMNYTFFGFNGVANTALYHPSTIDSAKFVLGLPGLSRLEFSTVQNFANLGLFSTSNDFQTEFENMISGLDEQSSLRFHNHIDLFLLGMRFKRKTYITLGAYQEAYAILSPPGQLLDMIYNGNVQYLNQTIDMSQTNISGMAFGALHAGIAQQFGRRFTLGVRAKMISGLAAVQSDVRTLDLTIRQSSPAPYTWEINSDFDVYTNADTVNYVSNLLNFVNYGFAFDFSADYRLTRRITLSGGMRNMGSINWSDEYSNLAQSNVSNFEFDGVEIVLGSGTDIEEQINQLIDTLASPFNIVNQKGVSWSSSLPSTSYAQVSFRLTPNQIISGNYFRHDFLGTPLSAYGVSYSGAFGRGLRLKGNVMIMDDGTQNWGAGVSLGNALQFYLAMDYVQNLTDINQFTGVSTALGLNFTFGKQSRKSYEVSEREYWKAKRLEKREARNYVDPEKVQPALPSEREVPNESAAPSEPTEKKSNRSNGNDAMDDIIYKSNMNNIPPPPAPTAPPVRKDEAPAEVPVQETPVEREVAPQVDYDYQNEAPTSVEYEDAVENPLETQVDPGVQDPVQESSNPGDQVQITEPEISVPMEGAGDPEITPSPDEPATNMDTEAPAFSDSTSISNPTLDSINGVPAVIPAVLDSMGNVIDSLNFSLPVDLVQNVPSTLDTIAPSTSVMDSIPGAILNDSSNSIVEPLDDNGEGGN